MSKAQIDTCIVTACDRGGHVLQVVRITRQSEKLTPAETLVIRDRGVVFADLRARFPDCQIYYDWHRDCSDTPTPPQYIPPVVPVDFGKRPVICTITADPAADPAMRRKSFDPLNDMFRLACVSQVKAWNPSLEDNTDEIYPYLTGVMLGRISVVRDEIELALDALEEVKGMLRNPTPLNVIIRPLTRALDLLNGRKPSL